MYAPFVIISLSLFSGAIIASNIILLVLKAKSIYISPIIGLLYVHLHIEELPYCQIRCNCYGRILQLLLLFLHNNIVQTHRPADIQNNPNKRLRPIIYKYRTFQDMKDKFFLGTYAAIYRAFVERLRSFLCKSRNLQYYNAKSNNDT